MKGNFAAIIYENGEHPALNLQLDKHLDKHKFGKGPLYDYEKLKTMPLP